MSIEITEFSVEHASAEAATADWSFYVDADKMAVVERAARSVARKYEDTQTTEYDDALQDALELMATKTALRGDLELGILYTRLCQRLSMKYRTEAGHRTAKARTSWEHNAEKLTAMGLV